jgi:hypothetical protein
MSVVLLWGDSADRPFALVASALRARRAELMILDQRDMLATALDLQTGAEVRGGLRVGDRVCDLADVSAVYVRTYDWRSLPAMRAAAAGGPEWQHAVNLEEALYAWLEITPARVINRPSCMASNGSKPYQAELIRRHGFEVPETLITTDSQMARDFIARHRAVIYKSISGTRSIVSCLTPMKLERLADIAWCPTQFQAQVAGVDHRVHVIGDQVYACEILCAADDYRYAARSGASAEIRATTLPEDVTERCRHLARALGLDFAGIDLRRRPDGAWVCFEVNPSPGFSYYEQATGQPIAAAVAHRLLHAEQTSVPAATCDARSNLKIDEQEWELPVSEFEPVALLGE